MKKLSLMLIAALALTYGCNNENKAVKKLNEIKSKAKETKEAVSAGKNIIKEAGAIQDDIKKLAEITPLTKEEFKDWLPDEVLGMPRVSYKSGTMGMVNISSVEAAYRPEDKSKTVTVMAVDGAGEMGASALVSLRMMLATDFEEESESTSKRTVTQKNYRALEEYNKRIDKTTLQLLYDDRFFITVKADHMTPEETWKAVNDMNLKKLIK